MTTSGGCSYTLHTSHLNPFSEMAQLLLESVEGFIGLIEGWPMPILQLLFLEPQTMANIMKVTAFFFMETGFPFPWSINYTRPVVR